MTWIETLEELTPKKIVEELNKYVVGQEEAKRAVAIALRNRWRRQKFPKEVRDEILPKNILMIGPTGVGKTEIARRLAQIIKAPFIKVEATKYTEIGYVGRNVESIIRDLVSAGVQMVKGEAQQKVKEKAKENALRIVSQKLSRELNYPLSEVKEKVKRGLFDDYPVEISVEEREAPVIGIAGVPGLEDFESQIKDAFSSLFPPVKKKRRLKVKDALRVLTQQEMEKLIDMEEVIREALYRVENFGIVFIDEIDKLAIKEAGVGGGVSREGVQRDLLPIVEGTTVQTKYGPVRTDHILFIAAGAFHLSKPSDLIPELQGRFPIRVELKPLNKEDFVRILKEPKNALVKQYTLLLKTEGVDLQFTDDAIEEIALIAEKANEKLENIGARRLHTVMEKLLEDISFYAPEMKGQTVVIDAKFVRAKLGNLLEDEELIKYVL